MVTFNLPSLDKKTSRLLTLDKPAIWTRLKSLDDLAQSLEISTSEIDASNLKSVPDPWGHITSFRDALFAQENAHPAHASALRIWRAILALLGTRASQSRYTLRTTLVDLAAAEKNGRDGLFPAIARRFAPGESFDDRLKWDSLWLLRSSLAGQDELLGMLSPLTLVVPARGMREGLLSELAGALTEFGSPLGRSLYTPEQLRALREFLANIATSIRAATPGSSRLMELLVDYQRDLDQAGATDAYPMPVADTRPLGELPAGTPFAALNRVWKPGEVQEAASDATIEVSEDFKRVFAGVVLADAALSDTLQRPADRIVLWRGFRLSALSDLEKIRKDAHLFETHGYLVITPDDLFSAVLAPLEGASIAAHGPSELAHMLLPVTPLTLLMWPIKGLLDNLSLREEGPGRWVAELKLKLIDKAGNKYNHVLRREFEAPGTERSKKSHLAIVGPNNEKLDAPFALAAWPDFSSPQWKWNFLHFSADYNTAAVPTSGFSTRILVKDLTDQPDCAARWAKLAKWASAGGPWDGYASRMMEGSRSWFERIRYATYDPMQREGSEREIERCDYGFDAVSFAAMKPSGYASGAGDKPAFAGIGLMSPSVVGKQVGDMAAEVATDFGTTNTTIYAKYGGKQRELHFAQRLRTFNSARGNPVSDYSAYATFIPYSDIVPPFTTVMQGRLFDLRDADKDSLIVNAGDPALWRDYIFFDKNIAVTMSSIWDNSNGPLHFNIKWSEDTKDRERIARFLRQAGFMTLAELTADGVSPEDVRWRYSYPMAMSGPDIANFRDIATKVVGQLRDPGEPGQSRIPPQTVGFCTESAAAAVWYLNRSRFKTTSQIVMDIGGGTTDMALWTERSPVWADSFRLAGRNLIVEFLAQNRDFLDNLGLREAMLQSKDYREKFELAQADQAKFADAVGVIVNSTQFREALDNRFSLIAGTEAGRKLQCGAYLFLGGLLYYVGIQVRALLMKHSVDLLNVDHLRSLSVCFAGRGSTLFTLLDQKMPSDDSHLRRCLRLFAAAADNPDLPIAKLDVGAEFSEKPKHEVSEGMLYWSDVINSDPKESFSVLGEAVEGTTADGQKKRLEATSPEADLTGITRIAPTLIEEFDKFLKALDHYAGVRVKLGQRLLNDLETRVGEALRAKLNPGPHDDPDPPFIVMLRETIEQLYASKPGDQSISAELL